MGYGRISVAAAVLAFGLGCSGMTMPGVGDMPVAGPGMGGEHPSDFVFPAPEGGTLELATESDAMGRHNIVVTYKVSKDSGTKAMAKYAEILEGMDLQVSKASSPFESVSGVDMETMASYSASLQDASGEMRLSMTSSVPE